MPFDRKEYEKQYYQKNKERIKAREKEYNQSPAGIKKGLINSWKRAGLIETDYYTYDELYEAYLCCSECEECGVTLTTGNKAPNRKCLDHDHTTGIFRNILCNSCNVKRR